MDVVSYYLSKTPKKQEKQAEIKKELMSASSGAALL